MELSTEKVCYKFTYEDFLRWNYTERWELIDGVGYNIIFNPSREYERVSGILFRELSNYLKGTSFGIYRAPFPVKLATNTVLQPDILVCDEKLTDDMACNGPPEVLIEIIGSSSRDDNIEMKSSLYERSGIKECWFVYPLYKMIKILSSGKGRLYSKPDIYKCGDKFKSNLFEDFEPDLRGIF